MRRDETASGLASPDADGAPGSRYRVLGEIARGGMGVVLRGHDPDLGRDVALKVLRADHADTPELLERFVEEAQIAGQLQHPGIVPVYELGRLADDRPFFTMKLVQGRTLAELLAERRGRGEDRQRLVEVFTAVCRTMAYAHSRGVIHRDLKPSNVMVGPFGEVQVVDWGLSKILRAGAPPHATSGVAGKGARVATVRSAQGSSSVVGSILGTPAYMPPEQARGDVDTLDERSDVFSLGAILCEILTGSPPYLGATSSEVIAAAAAARLTPALERLEQSDADGELVALAASCLRPIPSERPKNAQELAERLTLHSASLEDRARRAQVEAAEARVKADGERKARRLTASLAAAVLAFVALGGGGAWWLSARGARERHEMESVVASSLADARLARARGDFVSARMALERVEARLDAGPTDTPLRRSVLLVREEIEREAERVERETRLREENRALVLALEDIRRPEGDAIYRTDWKRLDLAYAELLEPYGLTVDEGSVARVVDALAARGISPALAAALDDWSATRERAGNELGARRLTEIATRLDPDPTRAALRDALLAGDHESLRRLASSDTVAELPAVSMRLLARGLSASSDEELATDLLRAARLRFPKDFVLAMELGRRLSDLGDAARPEAVEHYRAAVALRPESVEAWHELGRALDESGRSDEAESVFRRAVVLWPQDAHLRFHIGNALKAQGRLERAIEEYRIAITVDPDDARAHSNLGWALGESGDVEGAIEAYRTASELDPGLLEPHFNLGKRLLARRDPGGAVEAFRKAVDAAPKDIGARNHLANALVTAGDLDAAVRALEGALELEPNSGYTLLNLANVFDHRGELERAIALCRRAIEADPKLAMAYRELAKKLARSGDGRSGLDVLLAGRRAVPDDPDLLTELGRALDESGDLDGALNAFASVTELLPESAEAWCNLGIAQQRSGRFTAALTTYRRAHDLGSSRPKWTVPTGEWIEAIEGVAKLEQRALEEPTSRDVQLEYAEELLRRGYDEQGARILERTLTPIDEDTTAEDRLIVALAKHRLGDDASARSLYATATLLERLSVTGVNRRLVEQALRELEPLDPTSDR